MTTAGSLPGIQPSLLRRKLQLASRVPQACLRERKHHAALKPTISSSQLPSLPSVVNRARTYSLKATTLKWRPPEQAEHTAGCGSQRRPPPRPPPSQEKEVRSPKRNSSLSHTTSRSLESIFLERVSDLLWPVIAKERAYRCQFTSRENKRDDGTCRKTSSSLAHSLPSPKA